MKLSLFFFFSLIPLLNFGQSILPEVSNVRANSVGKRQLQIHYDVIADVDVLDITLQIYDQANEYFSIITEGVTGDIGAKVRPGVDKKIIWKSNKEIPDNVKMRLIVDDYYKPTFDELQLSIDSAWISDMIKEIEGERHRFNDSAYEKLQEVMTRVKSHYQNIGLSVFVQDTLLQDFAIEKDSSQNLLVENIVATKQGVSDNPNVVLLTSHFDSGKESIGADDNASGLVASMEVARILSKFEFENTFRFVAFDHGKFGFLGSRFYAIKGITNEEKVSAVINLDMIGYYNDNPNSQTIPEGFEEKFPRAIKSVQDNENKGDFIMMASNINSGSLPGLFASMARNYVPDLKILSLTDTGPAYGSPLGVSDHSIFWMRGFPAIYLGDTGDQRKSISEQDTASQLNYNRIYQIVKVTIATMIDLGQLKHCAVEEFSLDKL